MFENQHIFNRISDSNDGRAVLNFKSHAWSVKPIKSHLIELAGVLARFAGLIGKWTRDRESECGDPPIKQKD